MKKQNTFLAAAIAGVVSAGAMIANSSVVFADHHEGGAAAQGEQEHGNACASGAGCHGKKMKKKGAKKAAAKKTAAEKEVKKEEVKQEEGKAQE